MYLATGLWPLLHMRSFEAVTGPKTDRWLVKTVGVLVSVIGAVLLIGRRRPGGELAMLAAGSAAGLAGIDLIYALRGRISKIYLLDAATELLLVGGWFAAGLGMDRSAQVVAVPAAPPDNTSSPRTPSESN